MTVGAPTLEMIAPAPAPARATGQARSSRAFDNAFSVLRQSVRPSDDPAQAARDAAADFVSVALVQPILSSLRDTNQAAEPFAPGDAERRFGPMWDAEIARRITRAENFPLVDSLARRLLKPNHATPQDPQAPANAPKVDTHA